MPRQKVLHFHWSDGKTRCGRLLRNVEWSADEKDVTCDSCKRLLDTDREKKL